MDRRPADHTGEAAVGDVTSVSLFGELLSRIEDKTDRVLLLARVGLEYSDRALSQAFNIERSAVDARVQAIISTLREDPVLTSRLKDVHRAGRPENYLALAVQLGLQEWFCSWCQRLMIQAERGARRHTCSNLCRSRLFRAGGVGWKTRLDGRPAPAVSPRTPAPPPAGFATASDDLLEKLVRTINRSVQWWSPERQLRDRAALLLGMTCALGLTPADIAALDADDMMRTEKGLELRLFRRTTQPVRYLTIAVRPDAGIICPATALMMWRRQLTSVRPGPGPLFVQLTEAGHFNSKLLRITGHAVARIAVAAVAGAVEENKPGRLTPTAPMLSLLK